MERAPGAPDVLAFGTQLATATVHTRNLVKKQCHSRRRAMVCGAFFCNRSIAATKVDIRVHQVGERLAVELCVLHNGQGRLPDVIPQSQDLLTELLSTQVPKACEAPTMNLPAVMGSHTILAPVASFQSLITKKKLKITSWQPQAPLYLKQGVL